MWHSTGLVFGTLGILIIHDFENCLENMTPNMYADDTCVTVTPENLTDLITDF